VVPGESVRVEPFMTVTFPVSNTAPDHVVSTVTEESIAIAGVARRDRGVNRRRVAKHSARTVRMLPTLQSPISNQRLQVTQN
jgi:hypothetical protein